LDLFIYTGNFNVNSKYCLFPCISCILMIQRVFRYAWNNYLAFF
jgi:hypothetical protein